MMPEKGLELWHHTMLPLVGLICSASLLAAEPGSSHNRVTEPEYSLARILLEIGQSRWKEALNETEALVQAYPNFRLGHLIKGDLLLAHTRQLQSFGEGVPREAEEQVAALREEALVRLRAQREKPRSDAMPSSLLGLRADQKYAAIIDAEKSRLYLFRNDDGTPRLIADYYVSYGKLGTGKLIEGDKKTPLGVYHVTGLIPREKLTDYYGRLAFPISYPNEWDTMKGRNGHGIWLHGTPSDTYSRPPKSSDGCLVLANTDLAKLAEIIQIGVTPVVISHRIRWLSLENWHKERKAFHAMIDEWRRDWESLDHERYARHYSRHFFTDGKELANWLSQKKKINARKRWIKVRIENLGILRSSDNDDYLVVTFDQDYQSNNLSDRMRKLQYWIREDGRWKIVYESAVN